MDKNEFITFQRPYERVLRQLLLEFEFFLEDTLGLNVYSINHRLKTFESASEKSIRYSLPISDLEDIGAIRIVASTSQEIEVIGRFFYRKADSKDLKVRIDKRVNNNGYRARHLILDFEGHYSRSVYPTTIEIQLQTIIENAFNNISRSWIYKIDRSLSKSWHKEFLKVSLELAKLDERITKLQETVLESAVKGRDDEPLTPFSFQSIVKEIFNENVKIDEAVDCARMLIDLQCDTNGKLRDFFKSLRILELRDKYKTLLKTEGKHLAEITLNMSMYSFYMMFGIRIQASEDFFNAIATSYKKLPTA